MTSLPTFNHVDGAQVVQPSPERLFSAESHPQHRGERQPSGQRQNQWQPTTPFL